MLLPPYPQSYWIREGLACGSYPGDREPEKRRKKAQGLLDAGIRRFVKLMEVEERDPFGQPFTPYLNYLQKLGGPGCSLDLISHPIRDNGVPTVEAMRAILDTLDASLREQVPTFVHCWGGHGRTSTVVGCFLVRHGASPDRAIAQIMAWRASMPKKHFPYTAVQERFVRAWSNGA